MGCNSSMNIQTKDNTDDRIIKVNVNKKSENKINNNKNDNNEQDNEEYLDLESAKKTQNGNTDCKTIINNTISDIHNMKINKNLYNYKSTNFKYLKNEEDNIRKSNPVLNFNKNEVINNNNEYITLKHPLDSSSNDGEDNRNLNMKTNKFENINIATSMEERIKNYKNDTNEIMEEDGVNMGNIHDEENDDMCNLGQSVDFEKKNETKNEKKEISVAFEIQSTNEKYNINTNLDAKLNDLVEMFKNKIELSPFEKPEFMFNGVYLIDYDKSIKEYNIGDKSKIHVFI